MNRYDRLVCSDRRKPNQANVIEGHEPFMVFLGTIIRRLLVTIIGVRMGGVPGSRCNPLHPNALRIRTASIVDVRVQFNSWSISPPPHALCILPASLRCCPTERVCA